MKVTLEMPCIRSCSRVDCAYNHDKSCHARAITIGHGTIPGCDTFFKSGKHCRANITAGVGACKVSTCAHNEDFECQAGEITMKAIQGAAFCTTFSMS